MTSALDVCRWMPRVLVRDERGSVMPLAAGYVLLIVVALFTFVNAASLHQAQQRLQGIADAAAMAAADGFTIESVGGTVVARLEQAKVGEQASAIAAASGVSLVSASSPDGVSTRVTVADVWVPIAVGFLMPDGFTLSATATSRTALH